MWQYLRNAFLFLVASQTYISVDAQRLERIIGNSDSSEFPTYPHAIEFDKADSLLYVGFWPCVLEDEIVPGLASWDGLLWVPVENTMDSIQCMTQWVRSIACHEGDLFVSGNIDSFGGLGSTSANLGRFNGNGWTECGSPNSWPVLTIVEDTVWAIGWYATIAGLDIGPMARYVSGTWIGFGSSLSGNDVRALCKYNGSYVIGGNLTQSPVEPMQDILLWDGFSWQAIGEGLGSVNSWVNCMASFQGNLFVGGALPLQDGNPGQHLVYWNGLDWSAFFSEQLLCRNQVNDLQVINGKLYMAGVFQFVGDSHYYNLLEYDGFNLCAVGKDLNASAGDFARQVRGNNSEIYFSTTHVAYDLDTVNYLAKWVLANGPDTCISAPLSIVESNGSLTRALILENPQCGQLVFTIVSTFPLLEGALINLYGIDGRSVMVQPVKGNLDRHFNFDISHLTAGCYILTLEQQNRPNISSRIVLN